MPQSGLVRALPRSTTSDTFGTAGWVPGTSAQCALRFGDAAINNAVTGSANMFYAHLLEVPFDVTVDAIGVHLNLPHASLTLTFRLGLALCDNANGTPGSFVADGGTVTIAPGAAAGVRLVTIPPQRLLARNAYAGVYAGDVALSGSGPYFRRPSLNFARTQTTAADNGPFGGTAWAPTKAFQDRLPSSSAANGYSFFAFYLRRYV